MLTALSAIEFQVPILRIDTAPPRSRPTHMTRWPFTPALLGVWLVQLCGCRCQAVRASSWSTRWTSSRGLNGLGR